MCSRDDSPDQHDTEYAAAAVSPYDTIAAGRREPTTAGTGRVATGEARPAPAWSFAVALVLFAIVVALLALFAATEGVG